MGAVSSNQLPEFLQKERLRVHSGDVLKCVHPVAEDIELRYKGTSEVNERKGVQN